MRRDGDEAQLQLVEGDHLVVDARLLDRDREPFRDQLQQLRLVAREEPRGQRPDVEHARDVLADGERDAEQGLDALDPEQGIEHVGVIDVGQPDRPALGRDPAGEALPQRDPDALLHLLLETDRRAGDELAPLGVDEEDGDRIDAEDRADPFEELGEQRVELEMGETGVDDRLHVLDPHPRRPLRVERLRVGEPDRDTVGRLLEQLHIVPAEVALLQRAHVDDTDRPAVDDQRDTDQARDPPAADQWVEHVRVLHVGEHDGPQLRGDPSGEPFADRDAEARLQLLLDPDGRVGEELVALLVEQQDRAGVGGEEGAGAVEHVARPLGAVIRECGVRDGLQAVEPVCAPFHERRMADAARRFEIVT